jgi:hypothetical protein
MVDTNWGFTAGFQDAQQTQIDRAQKQQLFEMSMDIDRTKLAGAQLDLKERETALDNAKAIQKLQSGALSKLAFDPKMDPVDKVTSELQAMAEADTEGGFPVQGAELLKQSVVVAKDHVEITEKLADQRMKDIQYVANLADTVHDQQSLDTAKMIAQGDGHKLPPEIAHMQWDPVQTPKFLQQLKAMTTTQMQKLEMDQKKAQITLEKVQAREGEARIPLIKAQADAAEALAAERRKNAGEAGGPSKEDLAAAYDLVRPLFKSENKNAVPADNAAAKSIALPIAERIAQLRKTGMSRSAAAAKALQEEKQNPASRLQDLSKPPPVAEAGVQMIDDILAILDQADQSNKRITGVPGMARRIVKEDIGGTMGLTNDTIANQFESKLTALQVELPALLLKSKSAGYFSKLKAEKMATIARGLRPGDNSATTRATLMDLRDQLSDRPSAASKGGDFEVNQDYTDANGNTATYLGNGQWQPKTK